MAQISTTDNFSDAVFSAKRAGYPHVWIEDGRLAFGLFPSVECEYSFLVESLIVVNTEAMGAKLSEKTKQKAHGKRNVDLLDQCPRITFISKIETKECDYTVGSAKQLLMVGLDVIEKLVPGAMAELSKIKKRSKRIVSKSREDLYDTPHPESHSAILDCGYWVATNNRSEEVNDFLAEAAMHFGFIKEDFFFGPAKSL